MSNRAIKRYEDAIQRDKISANIEKDEDDRRPAVQDHVEAKPNARGVVSDIVNMFGLLVNEEGEVSGDDPEVSNSSREQEQGTLSEQETLTSCALRDSQASELLKGDHELDGAKRRRRKKKKRKNASAVDDEDWFTGLEPAAANREGSRIEDLPDIADLSRDPAFIPDDYFYSDDDAAFRSSARALMKEVIELAHPDGVIPGAFEASARASRQIVAVDARLLSADAELKRLFGARVVETERRNEEHQDPYRRMQRHRGQYGQGLRKRTYLVKPRDTWVRSAPGLVMVQDDYHCEDEVCDDGSRIRYFRYAHESQYSRIQDEYRAIVSVHDPNLLVDLIRRYPFHVDTLLQLAEVYRQMGELEHAGELIERALFVLESAWHRGFKPFDGECRLRFAISENRSLFVALFRYAQLITRRGLHRTALETSKLLLNFDPPGDPLGVLMMADSLALLSGEYDWIRSMHCDYHHIPLEFFPNFSLSSAVARHCKQEAAGARADASTSRKKLLPHRVSNGDCSEPPVQMVSNALLAYPMLLRPLLVAMKESTDICDRYILFDDAVSMKGIDDGGALIRMCRIYAERSKLWWNSPANVRLLRDGAVLAGASAAGGRGAEGDMAAAEGLQLRNDSALFLKESRLYEEMQIADFSESGANLPQEVLQDAERGQPAQVQQLRAPASPETIPAATVSAGQAALAFLESLLPWRDTGTSRALEGHEGSLARAGFDGNIWEQLQQVLRQDNADAENGESSGTESATQRE
jgi:Transcriptional repressor TCF25